jgi:hypothetical protein
VAIIAFVIAGLLILVDGIVVLVTGMRSWAYAVNNIAVSIIVMGLAAGLTK